jgi:hypothetical protein
MTGWLKLIPALGALAAAIGFVLMGAPPPF